MKDKRTPEQILADLKARAALAESARNIDPAAHDDGYRLLTDDERVQLREDAKRIREEFLKLRADRRAIATIDDDGTITYGNDDTEHLMSSAANVEHINRSIEQFRRGEGVERELIEPDDEHLREEDGE